MKILITGAKGQLGTELCRQLKNGGSALGRVPDALRNAHIVAVDVDECNLANLSETIKLVNKHDPNVVINCAAFTAVDKAESERDAAFAANAIAPRNLAMVCETIDARLMHISTDYVFAGDSSAPYTEAALTAPNTVYGATKRLGEEYVQSFCTRWFIVRTAWLYARRGGNFVRTMLKLGAQKDEITVVDDQFGNPTNAEDLAHHLLMLAATQHYGIYHCTGGGVCTWQQFASEIMRFAGLKTKVLPCTTAEYALKSPTAAPRPAYSALEHTMLRLTVGDKMRPWQEALRAFIEELRQEGDI